VNFLSLTIGNIKTPNEIKIEMDQTGKWQVRNIPLVLESYVGGLLPLLCLFWAESTFYSDLVPFLGVFFFSRVASSS
jgi:hypothetical protein